jgi:hypothetical protein
VSVARGRENPVGGDLEARVDGCHVRHDQSCSS